MSTTLPVNEVFATLQGEASWAGTPSVFIRLQGCKVGCSFCDTKFTWEVDERTRGGVGAVVSKRESGSDVWAMMTVDQIVEAVIEHPARHVVITGGEPCDYDLTDLTTRLIDRYGLSVQIETSGTAEIRTHGTTWVTVSPKIGMPGGLKVRQDALDRANEIKMPVGREADVIALLDLLGNKRAAFTGRVWLQPLSMSKKATDICIEAATAHAMGVSLQLHKFAGWR